MIKNILITGANGQLGRELRLLVENNMHNLIHVNFYFTDKNSLNITDKKKIKNYISEHSIDTIINCAAYTAVDKAEENEPLARQVNKDAVAYLGELAHEKEIFLIHISTDYVFDGNNHLPYKEDDIMNPQNVYGKTKLAGEKELLRINPYNAIIIRTSWIYSTSENNFLHTMLKLREEKKKMNVVCDQTGTPTDAKDLANVLLTILEKETKNIKDSKEPTKIYHYSNEGSCTWYEFAQAIFDISHLKCNIQPISSENYSRLAKRPYFSVLNKDKIKEKYNLKIPYWRDSLEKCISRINYYKPKYKIGIIGSGFIASGLAKLLMQHSEYKISAILTRSNVSERKDFQGRELLTNSLDVLIESSDLIVECTGDAIYATETISKIIESSIPIVTMNSEFHVTTGSYFVNKGLITEAEGDQPGVQAILHEEAVEMGFKPIVYANIKGFLNKNPELNEMKYWGEKSNLSLEMVTSFTDGTKVSFEQVLVANGLGAGIIQDGLLKLKNDDMLEGGTILASKAKTLGYPVSDYVLSSTLPAGVFLIVEHNENQADSLKYYKLGDGPYYVLERTYHLCHLEIIKTIKRVLTGGGVLLNNSAKPRFSVAAVAKNDLEAGKVISRGIGSFDVRGIAVNIKDDIDHVPIGLLANVTLKRKIKKGERIRFDDISMPENIALNIWKEILCTI